MVKKTFTFLAIMLLFAAASAQTVTLTFTGQDAANQHVQLDSVSVTNQTKGWSETLVWPDTILTMQNGTGIDETVANGGFGLSQNNPNPFSGITDVNLTVADAGAVTLEIADVNGKIVGTHRVRPEIGTHQFRVTLSATGTYILTARQNGKTSSVKMVCNGTGDGNRIEYMGEIVKTTHALSPQSSPQPKSHTRGLTDNPFSLGDQMEYVGYATVNGDVVESRHVTRAQNASETIVLTFDVVQVNMDAQPCPGTTTVTDIDGNVYNTVMIGTQCWMKENLRTTKYTDNTPIPLADIVSYTEPYRHAPDNDEANVAANGYLYNWAAVMHSEASSETNPSGVQGICPNGWHVPSDAEWTQLTDYVSSHSEYGCGNNPSDIAKSLAADTIWGEENDECTIGYNLHDNNATGFSALPAGCFNTSGEHLYFGEATYIWSSTANTEYYAYTRYLGFGRTDVYRSYRYKKFSGSVRCLRD